MGGVLEIRKEPSKAVWLPQSSTYDALLEHAAAQLADHHLAAQLLGARLAEHGGYLSIDQLDPADFRLLIGAVRDALENAKGEMTAASIAELLALLRTDPRADEASAMGTIVIDDQKRWTGPRWLFDFLAAHLDRSVSDRVQGVLDVRGRAKELLPAAEWMMQRYGDGGGRGGYDPQVYAQIAEAVNALREILKSAA